MRLIQSLLKPKTPTITPEELARYRQIITLAGRLVKDLEDGKVDYDLVEKLKALLSD